MILTSDFDIAVKDYLYLSERNYPQKGILKLIGDRYGLTGEQRTMLYRGITTSRKVSSRKDKLIDSLEEGDQVSIDTLNVLITVGSYLKGKPVFIANDYFLRDAFGMRSKLPVAFPWERSAVLIISYLENIKPQKVSFFIDRKENFSDQINKIIVENLKNTVLHFKVIESDSTDRRLAKVTNGVLASSDSWIIDNSEVKVFDLSRKVLEFHFNPNFLNLFQRFKRIL